MEYWDRKKLRNIWEHGQTRKTACRLGERVDQFLRKVVIPRQQKLAKLGLAWGQLLPAELLEHSCLDKYQRGQLTVLVDSASHFYELNTLVKEGLADQIRDLCPDTNLAKIKLLRGVWYRADKDARIVDYKDNERPK